MVSQKYAFSVKFSSKLNRARFLPTINAHYLLSPRINNPLNIKREHYPCLLYIKSRCLSANTIYLIRLRPSRHKLLHYTYSYRVHLTDADDVHVFEFPETDSPHLLELGKSLRTVNTRSSPLRIGGENLHTAVTRGE